MKRILPFAFFLSLWLLYPPHFILAKTNPVEKRSNGIVVRLPDGFLNVRFFSDHILRVSFSKKLRYFTRKTLDVAGLPDPKVHWSLQTTDNEWVLKGDILTALIDRSTGRVQFQGPDGKPLLMEESRSLEPAEVQGEKTFHVRQQWLPNPDESLYGLGQQQLGVMDLKGYDLDLWQHNTNVVVPFLVSNRGFGILWDNPSYSKFGDTDEFTPIPAQCLSSKAGRPGGLTLEALESPVSFQYPVGAGIHHDIPVVETLPMAGSSPISTTADIGVTFHGKNWNDRPASRRWEGFLTVPRDGDYQLRCYSNGGIKVWLDDRLVMDHWRQKWLAAEDQVKVGLKAGKHYPFRIEWSTEQGSTLRFQWKTPPTQSNTSFWSEVGDGIDYYFVEGPGLDKVVAGYRSLTGQAPLMPSWAFGLWQSRQRYETAQQSLDVVDGFRKRAIPFDNIVQDWMYWRKDTWGSHQFDPDRFPDPDGWLKALHENHAHVMISVWGKFYPGTDNFKAMLDKGFLYQPNLKEGIKDWLGFPYTFYDAFNPKARRLFWGQMDKALFQKGIDAWWMDATEPDLMPSPPTLEGQEAHLNPTALGPGAGVLNAYPLENSTGIYDGQRAAAPGQRVFILTRSGYAGSQRTASAIWSGDVTSTWTALAKQIPAGLNFSLSGIPYWTTDTGGYTMPWKFNGMNHDLKDEDEWRELNTRWFEFSTFCPLLRVHGELRPREMWTLGGDTSPAYKAELKFDRLRYRLFPYLYSTAWAVTKEGQTFMRPLAMDFPDDATARELVDEYMFGKSFLVAPVTHYRARSRPVYLPPQTVWYDFWSGRVVAPGSLEAPAPYDALPLFIPAGSIIPFGPELQYIAEKPQDPTTLYVYAGADGDFTLYEDDGLTYDYEKGAYAEIPVHWDDKEQTLELGGRRGTFRGILEKRTFYVVLVSKDKPAGFSFDSEPAVSVPYDGTPVSAKLRKP